MWFWIIIVIFIAILVVVICSNKPIERFTTKPRSINVACLYAAYNLDEHDLRFISKYSKDIPFYIINNGELSESAILLKEKPNIKIVQRDNTGYDSGAWKAGLSMFDFSKYDLILFMNNSCIFGGDILRLCEHASDYDLYSYGFSYELYKQPFNKPHLHAYTFCVSNRLYRSPAFAAFWDTISETEGNHETSVDCNEYRLKSYFERYNFKVGAYRFFDVEDTYNYTFNDQYNSEIIKKREMRARPEKLVDFNKGIDKNIELGY